MRAWGGVAPARPCARWFAALPPGQLWRAQQQVTNFRDCLSTLRPPGGGVLREPEGAVRVHRRPARTGRRRPATPCWRVTCGTRSGCTCATGGGQASACQRWSTMSTGCPNRCGFSVASWNQAVFFFSVAVDPPRLGFISDVSKIALVCFQPGAAGAGRTFGSLWETQLFLSHPSVVVNNWEVFW